MILVTGGAGFIGSNFVLKLIGEEKGTVVNLDKLTFAGNLNNLSRLEHHPNHHFIRGDIRNKTLIQEILTKYRPTAIVHFAAENHQERSIYHPEYCVQTNILGTFDLLEESYSYWKQLNPEEKKQFRFLHVSSDEVYGPASPNAPPVGETIPYAPKRPYAATKACADFLVQTFFYTYGFPTLITRSPKNYGPYQFPEKLIPQTIVKALQGKSLPVHDKDLSSHPWLYVGDHCDALRCVLNEGIPGETYNIDAQILLTNKELIDTVCQILDELKTDSPYKPHHSLIKVIKDKNVSTPMHPLDSSKIRKLGWKPKEPFELSLCKTVQWYLHNMSWLENVISGEYRDWVRADYVEAVSN